MKKTIEHYNNYLNIFHDGKISDNLVFYIVQKGNKQAMSADNVEKFMKKYVKSQK
jgi:hypothetical protein